MVLSGAICIFSIAMPYAIVPLRKNLGYSTHQWDNDPDTHPMLSWYGDDYKTHKFDDPKKLAAWSQHKPYRCVAGGAHAKESPSVPSPPSPSRPPSAPLPPFLPLACRYNVKPATVERDFPEARARLDAQ